MIMLLNTTTPTTELVFVITKDNHKVYRWESGRELSKDLLKFIKDCLDENNLDFTSLTGLGFYRGPGSFTGLRIGVTVMNTLAYALETPIVGSTKGDWLYDCIAKLDEGKNDQIVMPFYGAGANVTSPRK